MSLGKATPHSGKVTGYLEELATLRNSIGRTLQLLEDRYAQLQASEERFRTLIDSAPEAIITFDLDLEAIVEANPHAALLFGCSIEALKASRLQDFYEPRQPDGLSALDSIRSHSQRALAGEDLEFERTLLSRDGTRRVCTVHLVKLPSHGRKLVRSTFIDITARKQAELGLQQTLQELVDLKTALDMSAIVSITDNTGVITDVNAQFCEISGFQREEILGRSHRLVGSDHHPTAYFQELWSTIAQGQIWRGELCNRSKAGSPYWLDTTIVPFRDAMGVPLRYMAIQVDITERKQHEEALRKLSQVVEQSPVSILMADIHGVIEYANPAVYATSGFSPEEVLGQTLWLFQMTGLDQAQDQNLWKCLKAGREWRGTTARTKRNGDPLLESVIISRVTDATGKPAHFLCLKEDITSRKKAEEDRGQLEMQLFHAQKMEALGQLAGGVAHDMNNMLTAVMGHLELLRLKVPGHKDVEFHTNAIALASNRSKDIVAKVLAFSRKQVIAPKVLDLNEHIATTRETIGPLIGEDIRMSFWPAPGLWPVNVDPSQIDQIVMNLAVNARDAMPDGGELAMETANRKVDAAFCERHSQAIPGSYVVLTVRDTGTGIDQATLTRIFEPFFTTKAPGKGTGLGLSTVFGIAKQNDGFVTVTSEVGQGTTFKVYLPRFGEPAEAPQPEPAEAASAEPANAHILLVEDDPLLRNVVERLLVGLGHSVRTTDSPLTALQIAEHESTPIDLLLTDVIMPDLNGRELMERFRELRPNVPTLFMSGYSADIIAKKGILESGIHLLAKPFTRATLAKHLEQILPRSH